MRAKLTLILTLALLAPAGLAVVGASQDEYKIVVHSSNPVDALSRAEVARIFLKKTATWPNGADVVAVDQERTTAVRQAFSLDVHQKDADAISAHWQVLVFSGRDTPPRVLHSDAEVIDFVRRNPGAIAYVSPDLELEGVKAVRMR